MLPARHAPFDDATCWNHFRWSAPSSAQTLMLVVDAARLTPLAGLTGWKTIDLATDGVKRWH